MEDSDRHDQIEALAALKTLLDDTHAEPDPDEIRDAAIRAVNQFDASIAKHDERWSPYARRTASDPDIRRAATAMGSAGVERHLEYPGLLRRSIDGMMTEIRIRETGKESKIEQRDIGSWHTIATTSLPLAAAEMIAAPC